MKERKSKRLCLHFRFGASSREEIATMFAHDLRCSGKKALIGRAVLVGFREGLLSRCCPFFLQRHGLFRDS